MTQNITAPVVTEATIKPLETGVMRYFPLPKYRANQKIVLQEIEKAFASGKSIIILEGPVGSGKSAIAVTLAKAYTSAHEVKDISNGAHIVTPRKSLQDQYYADFSETLVLMKGRNAYPCTIDVPLREYTTVIKAIKEGKIKQPDKHSPNCADAPCKGSAEVYQICTESRNCPYVQAITVAQEHEIVVHNLHSFIYQSSFSGKFDKREMLIIDEAHEIENTIRDFISKKIYISKPIKETQVADLKTVLDWKSFFLTPEYIPEETEKDKNLKQQDKTYISPREEYLRKIESLTEKDYLEKGLSVQYQPVLKTGTHIQTGASFDLIPHYVGGAVNNLLLNYGEKVVLMSGTIYNKELFCRNLGINQANAYFIRIGSSFPKENRPIYLKQKYQINTSHANWNENFAGLIEIINNISSVFADAKGLIHAPSYVAAEQIRNALNNPRAITHNQFDFFTKLEEFFASKEPNIFISPICQQGVDFKDDRARFQIVVRVPYPSTSSKFVEDKVKTDFPWYNYQALIIFGQQIGRINRSDNDYGATFLVDERFNQFISRNSKMLPGWAKEAMIWK